jgi:hypothetical protein
MPSSSQPKSWRDVLPIHPAAELLPAMSETELRELGEDIKKNGLQAWVTLCNYDNKLCVLDGRNRHQRTRCSDPDFVCPTARCRY